MRPPHRERIAAAHAKGHGVKCALILPAAVAHVRRNPFRPPPLADRLDGPAEPLRQLGVGHGPLQGVFRGGPLGSGLASLGPYRIVRFPTLHVVGAPGNLVTMSDVTRILNDLQNGDAQTTDQLLPLVYEELRRLAAQKLASERPGQTLDATGLVHEAYVRLVGDGAQPQWRSRRHFFAAAAEAMRRILIEKARRKSSQKAGGGLVRQEFEETQLAHPERDEDLLALDEALQKFSLVEPLKAELVKLRYFGGLTADEAAQTLEISSTTADRYWAYARAWLYQRIQADSGGGPLPKRI